MKVLPRPGADSTVTLPPAEGAAPLLAAGEVDRVQNQLSQLVRNLLIGSQQVARGVVVAEVERNVEQVGGDEQSSRIRTSALELRPMANE